MNNRRHHPIIECGCEEWLQPFVCEHVDTRNFLHEIDKLRAYNEIQLMQPVFQRYWNAISNTVMIVI